MNSLRSIVTVLLVVVLGSGFSGKIAEAFEGSYLAQEVPDNIRASEPEIVRNAAGQIVGINNLEITGEKYDVQFGSGSFIELYINPQKNPTFDGDEVGANAALAAINSVLNSLENIPQSLGELPASGPGMTQADMYLPSSIYCIPVSLSKIVRSYGQQESPPEIKINNVCGEYNADESLKWESSPFFGTSPNLPAVYAQFSRTNQ